MSFAAEHLWVEHWADPIGRALADQILGLEWLASRDQACCSQASAGNQAGIQFGRLGLFSAITEHALTASNGGHHGGKGLGFEARTVVWAWKIHIDGEVFLNHHRSEGYSCYGCCYP